MRHRAGARRRRLQGGGDPRTTRPDGNVRSGGYRHPRCPVCEMPLDLLSALMYVCLLIAVVGVVREAATGGWFSTILLAVISAAVVVSLRERGRA